MTYEEMDRATLDEINAEIERLHKTTCHSDVALWELVDRAAELDPRYGLECRP